MRLGGQNQEGDQVTDTLGLVGQHMCQTWILGWFLSSLTDETTASSLVFIVWVEHVC